MIILLVGTMNSTKCIFDYRKIPIIFLQLDLQDLELISKN